MLVASHSHGTFLPVVASSIAEIAASTLVYGVEMSEEKCLGVSYVVEMLVESVGLIEVMSETSSEVAVGDLYLDNVVFQVDPILEAVLF